MLEEFLKYANGMNANSEVITWITQTINSFLKKKKPINQNEIEHIIDFLVSSSAPRRLFKMSIAQAKESADKWSRANQKKGKNIIDGDGDIKIIHQYADGTSIVKLLSTNAYKREGFLMSHCLGGYSISSGTDIYSYRDKNNYPHATFEVQKSDNEISQIKGKGNGPIHPRYIMPILDFLESIGQKPRPGEMKNLGYYHIHKDHHAFVKSIIGSDKNLVLLHGELYAYP
jgi:hypothetical protein